MLTCCRNFLTHGTADNQDKNCRLIHEHLEGTQRLKPLLKIYKNLFQSTVLLSRVMLAMMLAVDTKLDLIMQ